MAVQSRQPVSLNEANVLDLRHFTSHELRPLLDAEAKEWDRLLMWDYSSSAEMILRYADSRILPGYAALEDGKLKGYSFFVYEGNKAVIGDLFALDNGRASRDAIEHTLLEHVIETLQQTPGITRIEAQLLLHATDGITAPFLREDFRNYRRLFMTLDVAHHPIEAQVKVQGLKLRKWQEQDFQPASIVITRAYNGHVDSLINDQYRSGTGSMRFLNNIVRFPGCGIFDPNASFVIFDEQRNQMAGLLLCSRVRKDVAHITQVCFLPEYRGRGLGRLLIAMCADELRARKVRKLTLTVTEANANAVALYEHLGFHTDWQFDAFVWER